MSDYFFHWYNGAIWGNILASVIWVLPGYLWGRYHARKLHKKLDVHHEHIKDIHGHLGLSNKGDQ